MAKLIPVGASDIRGSQGGTVWSRNRFGLYTRNRVSPVQPRTDYQLDIRAKLQTISASWRNLTEAQRAAWRALADQVILTDSLGQPYSPTGQQLYVSCNINLLLAGATVTPNPPPAVPNVPTPLNVTVTATGGATPALTVAWTGGDDNYDAFIYATPTLSKGINFYRPSLFKLIRIATGAGTPPVAILTDWAARYGNPPNPADGKVVVRVRLVDPNTGFASGIVQGEDTW